MNAKGLMLGSGVTAESGEGRTSGRRVVDSHHHLWKLDRFPYRWLLPEAPPRPFGDHTPLKRDYLLADYLSDTAGLSILGSVFVEAKSGADDPGDEVEWVKNVGQSTVRALVALAELDADDVEARIARLAGIEAVRGVRAHLAWDEDPAWRFADRPGISTSQEFRRGLDRLAAAGFSLDVLLMPYQMGEAAAIADGLRGNPLIIDHLGMPRFVDAASRACWLSGLADAARHDNVFVKLSGLWPLSMHWDEAELRDSVLAVVDLFTPQRCMWGSNLPIERLMCPASTQVAILAAILKDRTAEDHDWIFRRTAAQAYRLDEASALTAAAAGGAR